VKQDMSQRPCSACASTTYSRSCLWCFVGGPRLICCACAQQGFVFSPEGRAVRGSHIALQAALDARQRAKEDEALKAIGVQEDGT
jgi:hypothetical protein